MREIKINDGHVIKVHDELCNEGVKFITKIEDIDRIKEEFKKVLKGEGLTIFRVRKNFSFDTRLISVITNYTGSKEYFWHERPDIDADPMCIELIIIK